MTKQEKTTKANRPGTFGYDDRKPATVSADMPREGDAKTMLDKGKEFVGRPTPYVADVAVTPPKPGWATAHGDRRLVLTIDGQNYNGLVADPGDRAAYAKMLTELADKVRIGVA